MHKRKWIVGIFFMLTACADLVRMGPRPDVELFATRGRGATRSADKSADNSQEQKAEAEKKLSVPLSLLRDDSLRSTAEACVSEINKTWQNHRRHRFGNIIFKVAEVVTATGFTVLSGVNAGLNGDIGENPKKGLGIAAIISAATFTGLASFDGWYSFNERTNNFEKDTRKKLVALFKAGQFAQCASDAEVSLGTRWNASRSKASEAYGAVAEAVKMTDLAAELQAEPPPTDFQGWDRRAERFKKALVRLRIWQQGLINNLRKQKTKDEVTAELMKAGLPKIAEALQAQIGNSTSDVNKLANAAEGLMSGQLAEIEQFGQFALKVTCGTGTDVAQRSPQELLALAHANLIDCVGNSEQSAFGPNPAGPASVSTEKK